MKSKTSGPRVSVVMSVYNAERYLARALDSILRQSFNDFEFIVIDDGSIDHSASIVETHADSRVKLIRNLTNAGQTRSLNIGVNLAAGDYIVRHDADDISAPDRIRFQFEFMESHPFVGLLGSAYQVIDNEERVLDVALLPQGDTELKSRLLEGNIFCHGSVMIRRTVLDKVGGYREQFPVTQDYDLWLRLAEHCELANLPEILYSLRFEPASVTQQKRNIQLAYQRMALELARQRRASGIEMQIPQDVLSNFPPEPERLFGYYRWATYLFYAAGQMKEGERMLTNALGIRLPLTHSFPTWEDWSFARAQSFANLRGDRSAGADFLKWIFNKIPNLKRKLGSWLARYYADQAFIERKKGRKRRVIINFLYAIKYDWRWIRNKGLWAIAFRR
jgi:glycosyltransferase involved in cell wall biosynthesis